MELKDIIPQLEESKEFKDWHDGHKDAYLAHAFVMLEEPREWQIGYFDGNTMSTFVVQDKNIKVIPDQEVLKGESGIGKLNLDDVKLKISEAMDIAQKTKTEHYSKEVVAKTFFIIQNLEAHGPVFNVTYFTVGFKTINIKISTKNGEILHHNVQMLAAFG